MTVPLGIPQMVMALGLTVFSLDLAVTILLRALPGNEDINPLGHMGPSPSRATKEAAMSLVYELGALFALLLVLIAASLWIPVALGVSSLLFLVLVDGVDSVQLIGDTSYNTVDSFVLTAIPLFILMGELILGAGISSRFYMAIAGRLRRVPGGLLHTNIVACAIMAAVCGSSVATAGAVGSAAIPDQETRGYNDRLMFGSIAGGGMLGILIPPSIILILYGSLAQQSVAQLFLAGILPGLLLGVAFMAYIAIRVTINPSLAPLDGTPVSTVKPSLLADATAILPLVLLILAVIGSIYAGLATPTEAGAVGAVAALLIGAAYRGLSWQVLKKAVTDTIRLTCFVVFIVVSAAIYSLVLVRTGISRGLVSGVIDAQLGRYALLLIIVVIFVVLGCFIDGVSIIFLTLPLLLPLVSEVGFNLIWFGIIVTILVEIGQLTPPMGLAFFVLQAIRPRAKISDMVLGSLPFAGIAGLGISVLIVFPGIALWLTG